MYRRNANIGGRMTNSISKRWD